MSSPPPLRLGLDYRPALLQSSGIARVVRELSRALAELPELELRLFGHSLSPARRGDGLPHSARLHRLPIPGRSLPLLARLGWDAARLSGAPSVFHWTDFVYPPVTRALRVLSLHDLAFFADPEFHGAAQSQVLQARCRTAVAAAALVICPTRASAEMAETFLELPAERLKVIPFGVDHLPRPALPRPLAEDYLLMLGTIEPRKNHLRLLQAWLSLPQPRPRLVVIGRPGWRCAATLQAFADAAAQGLIFLPGASDAETFAWLQHAQGLCYPSLLEGFGFPPLEALRAGVPVLAGDTTALREVLNESPVFVAPRSVEAIRSGLLEICAGLDTARIEAGRRHAEGYRWETCARQHAAAYLELLKGA